MQVQIQESGRKLALGCTSCRTCPLSWKKVSAHLNARYPGVHTFGYVPLPLIGLQLKSHLCQIELLCVSCPHPPPLTQCLPLHQHDDILLCHRTGPYTFPWQSRWEHQDQLQSTWRYAKQPTTILKSKFYLCAQSLSSPLVSLISARECSACWGTQVWQYWGQGQYHTPPS